MRTNRIQPQKGFTLVETLVAVTLLLLVIVGPMTIATRGLQNAFYAGDQTTAIFLAQEAIEHMQRLRDDNALSNVSDFQTDGSDGDGNTWNWYDNGPTGASGWSNCKKEISSSNVCDVVIAASPLQYRNCQTISQCRLNQYNTDQDGNGTHEVVTRVYGYGSGAGWTTSPYTRTIALGVRESVGGTTAAVPVTVTVSWNANIFGSTRSVVLQTYIYDHYSRFE
jgi:prepilin-type N-terminal cleavage/methylation domain-containing protein